MFSIAAVVPISVCIQEKRVATILVIKQNIECEIRFSWGRMMNILGINTPILRETPVRIGTMHHSHEHAQQQSKEFE